MMLNSEVASKFPKLWLENNTNQLNALTETPAGIIKWGTLHSTENSR